MNTKILIITFLVGISQLSCNKKDNPVIENGDVIPVPDGYKLVWNDEFNGGSLNTSKWDYMTGGDGWGNNELQYYTNRTDNAFIEDTVLVIQALKEDYSGSEYTSARLTTSGKAAWTYGRFDIRAKMPFGQGIWPALWMMPEESIYGGWAASGEIDIVEYLGHETNKVYGTLHYGGSYPNNTSSGNSYTLGDGENNLFAGDFSTDFHLFTLEWEPGIMRWLMDGELYATQTSETWYTNHQFGLINKHAPFDQNFHFIFNVAVGGNWPGNPNALTTFPQRLSVDYVRVFEKLDD
ncbi:glycoside hydrolase family 16 protein [candidate division KSB1 bacterium]|nr:glycoside hydrolase family 16 protein [candidate division KSB1 bacterium]